LPLYFWRTWQDKRHGLGTGALIDVTDLLGPAGEVFEPQVSSSFDNEGV
jgi:hypothetical protein